MTMALRRSLSALAVVLLFASAVLVSYELGLIGPAKGPPPHDSDANTRGVDQPEPVSPPKTPALAGLWDQYRAAAPMEMNWHLHCGGRLDESNSGSYCMLEIDFEGSISTTSVSAFRRMLGYGEAAFAALPPGRHLKYRALLNSPGGSVGAAMEFGRLLREKSASTNVNPNQQCVSACVLALIGGPERSVDGEVGIHRPYLDFDGKAQPPTAAQIQTTTNQVRDQMVAYLAEMNVPRKIVDDMMLIPPERVMKLNHRDLAAYGIFSNDPVYNEEIDIRIAKEFGLPLERNI